VVIPLFQLSKIGGRSPAEPGSSTSRSTAKYAGLALLILRFEPGTAHRQLNLSLRRAAGIPIYFEASWLPVDDPASGFDWQAKCEMLPTIKGRQRVWDYTRDLVAIKSCSV